MLKSIVGILREGPVRSADEVDANLGLDATNTSAHKIFLKCGYAAG